MVRIEDRLRLMIKLIFWFLLKFVLLLIWGASIWGDLYTIVRSICIRSISIKRVYPSVDILLWEYLGFTMGNFVV